MEESPQPKRVKTACTGCRQQKARCDSHERPGRCSRCEKLDVDCVISEPFKREHKRQRLKELEQETDELKRKLQLQPATAQPAPISMPTAAAAEEKPNLRSPPESHLSSDSPYVSTDLPRVGIQTPLASIEGGASDEPAGRLADLTVSRSLNGITLTATEIDEIFDQYFQNYACFLPLLDPETTPNAYYTQCPLLFWAIIGVACRTYPQNPTLMSALAPKVIELGLVAGLSSASPLHIIPALVLIVTWPFPKNNAKPEPNFLLSGMLLHIAMANGMHIPMASHEFSKNKIQQYSAADIARRAELWAHCLIVYQRTCLIKGQPPRSSLHLGQETGYTNVLLQQLPPALAFRLRCYETVSRCCIAVTENGLRSMTIEQERSLDVILRGFEAEIVDLEAEAPNRNDKIIALSCRMFILVFHFFKNNTLRSSECLIRVASMACAVIEHVDELGKDFGLMVATPCHMFYGVMFASISLIRIFKSSGVNDIDVERARICYFASINIVRKMVVENNDTPSKAVSILQQLWNSSKAFRKSDGSEFVNLRLRSRMALSPIVDATWWWRDEFESTYRTMLPAESTNTEVPAIGDAIGGDLSTRSAERQEPFFIDEELLSELEWALSGDQLLLSASQTFDPLAWPSAGNQF
ncbi:hypothetical protein ASPZODRAFT_133006 [Penicilliopsis zonata CBS 506.65]|uniref:Zn(2)-C6 fungal-type domain-containing protein n=1 Tax=Penicilliopsis zonata CBS 506.65 TaxID=1073090 RepID=A0A1L9SFJ1_9EURO|nr:hypothetical protein ASPZODRAFT_133006 [Penicilliopsis zonata CBS 506.65]OJJ46045.1 hypothetical protein ASPZODRAFT_133006 [Penicilliopsis zonata CBS 506.65]